MPVSSCIYGYDPLDRLVSTSSASGPLQQRLYQNKRLVTEVQGASCSRLFQYKNLLLAQRDNAGTRLLLTDLQRSVLSTDKQTHQGYSPYGERSIFSGLGSLLGFNGERPDPITGHYLLGNGHRAFNPVLMRFNSPDRLSPFGKGGINAYAYCSGDPVNWQDSSGRSGIRFLLSVLPVSAVVKSADSLSFFKQIDEVIRLANKALVPSSSLPDFNSPGRAIIKTASSESPLQQPFSRTLTTVNSNLDSHGVGLNRAGGDHYASLLKRVESGDISNTTAHVDAAKYWLTQTFGPERVVGVVMNSGGALLGSPSDANGLKTGAAIRWTT